MVTKNDLVQLLTETRPTLDDVKALKFKEIYPHWKAGIVITQSDIDQGKNRYQCDNILWKCIKPHTTQDNWRPSINTASLWTAINAGHSGTIDDPIPVPEVLTSFEYEWGKYYIESDVIYLCDGSGGKEGDKYTLQHKPSALIGHYFSKVE